MIILLRSFSLELMCFPSFTTNALKICSAYLTTAKTDCEGMVKPPLLMNSVKAEAVGVSEGYVVFVPQ